MFFNAALPPPPLCILCLSVDSCSRRQQPDEGRSREVRLHWLQGRRPGARVYLPRVLPQAGEVVVALMSLGSVPAAVRFSALADMYICRHKAFFVPLANTRQTRLVRFPSRFRGDAGHFFCACLFKGLFLYLSGPPHGPPQTTDSRSILCYILEVFATLKKRSRQHPYI